MAKRESKLCPGCASTQSHSFYSVRLPILCTFLFDDRESALKAPKADIDLKACLECGLIFNAVFDAGLVTYDDSYEESQEFSATYADFVSDLADRLNESLSLKGKSILEIGCGKGYFLSQMAKKGIENAVGYDPVFIPSRSEEMPANVTIYPQNFTDDDSGHGAALVIVRHTLEHVASASRFIGMIGKTTSDSRAPLFVEVPNAEKILKEGAFWDVYYEHSLYFSSDSLRRVLALNGYESTESWTAYDEQYLLNLSKPIEHRTLPLSKFDVEHLIAVTNVFKTSVEQKLKAISNELALLEKENKSVFLWGAGSKAVSLLEHLGHPEVIQGVVDINPYKHGRYMPSFGTPVLSPRQLPELQPDAVLIMNPVYEQEISSMIESMGLTPTLMTLK